MSAEGRRPRLDAVLRSILDGKYDNELLEIAAAIKQRQNERKRAVMEMVSEVFGDEVKIVPTNQSAPAPPPPPAKKASTEGLNVTKHAPALEGADDVQVDADVDMSQPIIAEKPAEAPLTGEFESRSPQFGSLGEGEVADVG